MSLSEAPIQFLGGILTQPLWKGFASNYGLPFRSTQQTEWGFIWRLSQIGERRTTRDKSWIDFHFTRRCSTWEAPQQILRISLSCLFHVWNFSYLSWNTADPHHHHHSHSYVSIEVIITITIIAIRQNLHHDTWQCWNWILFWTGLVWWNINHQESDLTSTVPRVQALKITTFYSIWTFGQNIWQICDNSFLIATKLICKAWIDAR